jgi:Carboxypeptidase regulatory-like domain
MARVRLVTITVALWGALGAVAPSLAAAGSISGAVSAASGGAPIQGVEVCSHVQPYTFEDTCAETNSGGAYTLGGLPAGSYYVHFSTDQHNLDYVNQYFDGKDFLPGDLVTIAASEVRTGVDAELRAGGVIAGAVTDAASANPVAGFPVCAFAQFPTGETGRCTQTDAGGNYAIKGLVSEEYEVTFEGEGEFNYLTQYWEGSETYGAFDPVAVTEGTTVSGIDAALHPGAEISGTLTEAGTHKPLAHIRVDLLAPGTEEVLKFVQTDSAGNYAFRGRPTGTYVVAFSRPQSQFDDDGFSTQYYKGATSFADATSLTVAPPEILTGIDGEVVNLFPPRRLEPIVVTVFPTPKPPKKCRKGFHRKKVKGKVRCVRKHKRRHQKHRHHGGSHQFDR